MATRLGEAFVTIKAENAQLKKDLTAAKGQVSSALSSMEKDIGGLSKAFGTVGQFAAGALAGYGLKEMGSAIFEAGMKAESLGLAFKTATGSATGMKSELAFLRSEAKRLGQEFYTAAESYKSILAASRGTTLQGEGVHKIYSSVAEASTALGLSAEQSQGALKAIEQSISKGKVQAEELRGQLGERLPGAFRIMAKAMGVTTAELDKMLQAGSVGSGVWLKFAETLSEEVKEGLTDASNSARASVNRLKTAWEDLKVSLSQGGIGDATASAIEWLTKKLDGLTQSMERNQKNVNRISADREKLRDIYRSSGDLMGFLGMTNSDYFKQALPDKAGDWQGFEKGMEGTGSSYKSQFDDYASKINAFKPELRALRDQMKDTFGVDWTKSLGNELTVKTAERKNLESQITKQKEIQAQIAERELNTIEQIEVTYQAFGGTWTQIESAASGVFTVTSGLNNEIKDGTDLLKQMDIELQQIETGNLAKIAEDMAQKRSEKGKSVFGDSEYMQSTQRLLDAKLKSETDINQKLAERQMLEQQLQYGFGDATKIQEELAQNQQLTDAIRTRFEITKQGLSESEALRMQGIAAEGDRLREQMAIPLDELNKFIKLAASGKLEVDTSAAVNDINQIKALIDSIPTSKVLTIYGQLAMSPAVPFTQGYNKLIGMIGNIPSGMDYTIRMLGNNGASLSTAIQSYQAQLANSSILQKYAEWQHTVNTPASMLAAEAGPWGRSYSAIMYSKGAAQFNMNYYAAEYQKALAAIALPLAQEIDSGGNSSLVSGTSGGSSSPVYNINIINKIDFKGTGNTRDDIITLQDRLSDETVRQIQNGQWKPLDALRKKLS